MSANMGRTTNTDSYNKFQLNQQLAVGMQETNTCKHCGIAKSSKQHRAIADNCSKALQAQYLADKKAKEEAIEKALMLRFGCAA